MSKSILHGLAGFSIGIVISLGAVAFAAQMDVTENSYPITLNGAEVSIDGYNIDGITYFKLRDIGDVIGFDVEFENDTISLTSDNKPQRGDIEDDRGPDQTQQMTLEEFTEMVNAEVTEGTITQEDAENMIANFNEKPQPPQNSDIPFHHDNEILDNPTTDTNETQETTTE